MPFRIAVTGRTNTPSIFHIAEVMGRDEVIKRLHLFTA
jgi:glutamyl/glutaminyl-tRNA synthetase